MTLDVEGPEVWEHEWKYNAQHQMFWQTILVEMIVSLGIWKKIEFTKKSISQTWCKKTRQQWFVHTKTEMNIW